VVVTETLVWIGSTNRSPRDLFAYCDPVYVATRKELYMSIETKEGALTRRTLLMAGAAASSLATSGCGGASAAGTVRKQDVTFKSEGDGNRSVSETRVGP